MRRPSRLAVLLLALAVIVSAVYYTGAFSSLTAQRDASVEVTGDASGYLGLAPADGPNGEYASYRNGQLRVSLDGALEEDASGSGVNPDAVTTISEIFTITNQGTQPVGVWLTDESETVHFESTGESIEGEEQAVGIQPGESVPVGLVVDTHQEDGTLTNDMTIHADTDVDGRAVDEEPENDDSERSVDSEQGDSGSSQEQPQQADTQNDDEEDGGIVDSAGDALGGFWDTTTDTAGDAWDTTTDVGGAARDRISSTAEAANDLFGGGRAGGIMSMSVLSAGTTATSDGPVLIGDTIGVGILALGVTAATGVYLYDNVYASGGEEVEETDSENVEEPEQSGRYEEANERVEEDESSSDSDGSRRDRVPRRPPPDVLPDGGEEDHSEGYEALHEQGVPEETIEEWERGRARSRTDE